MAPVQIGVTSERGPYRVLIAPGLVSDVDRLTRPLGSPRVVVTTAGIWRLHGRRLGALARRRPVLVPDGERAKSLRTIDRLYDAFVREPLDRGALIIAFGGGVLGDVAGYAAATYLRGVSLVQVPTTLVAQVDSAIGGKVGVNLPAGKNLVGAFHPPRLVVCDPTLLATLPGREFRAGLFEVIKYGIIASRPLFERLSRHLDRLVSQDLPMLASVIAECCAIKASIVMSDEREAGPRRALNFGHTIGHALEAVTGYRRFRHGEAIGYGMLAAARVSLSRGLLGAEDEARVVQLITGLGRLPPVSDLSAGDILEAVSRDKKVVGRRLHFVLASGIGAVSIVPDVSTLELRRALRHLGIRP